MRFTKSAAGIIVDGRSDGRGAWLCRSRREDALVVPHCLDTALAKGQFARAWRGPLSADDERTIRELAGMVAGGDTLADGH